jgi:prepilin-type N-terminal cleavage/methylation domain-containing protein
MRSSKPNAFTLLEVVVAVGIFAIGMVAVIGLFTPVAKSVSDHADAEAATRVTDLLNAQLQAQEAVDAQAGTPFATVTQLLKVGTAKSGVPMKMRRRGIEYPILVLSWPG